MGPRRTGPVLLLFAALVASGCATTRASDRILGLVLLEGTEQPIAGATLTLTPVAPLPQSRRADVHAAPYSVSTELRSQEEGAFSFASLTGEGGQPMTLLRGWEYELRCEAPGFFSGVERVDYLGGEEAVVIQIEVIEDEMVMGDGGLFVGEQPPDRLKDVEGTLVDEILRRLGRKPPPGRPTR